MCYNHINSISVSILFIFFYAIRRYNVIKKENEICLVHDLNTYILSL